MKPFKLMQTGTVDYSICSQLYRPFLFLVMRLPSLRPLFSFTILICYSFLFQFTHRLSSMWIALVHTSNSGPSFTLSNFLLHVLNEYCYFFSDNISSNPHTLCSPRLPPTSSETLLLSLHCLFPEPSPSPCRSLLSLAFIWNLQSTHSSPHLPPCFPPSLYR